MKKPVLVVTLGYPGSGKTHFSERLTKSKGWIHLNSDRTRVRMFKNPTHKPEEHARVFGFMDWIAAELLRSGVSVVYDANVNKRIYRKRLKQMAKRVGAHYMLVWVKTKQETALKRLAARRGGKNTNRELYQTNTPDDVFHRLKAGMELPTRAETYLEIDGHAAFSKQLLQFNRALRG